MHLTQLRPRPQPPQVVTAWCAMTGAGSQRVRSINVLTHRRAPPSACENVLTHASSALTLGRGDGQQNQEARRPELTAVNSGRSTGDDVSRQAPPGRTRWFGKILEPSLKTNSEHRPPPRHAHTPRTWRRIHLSRVRARSALASPCASQGESGRVRAGQRAERAAGRAARPARPVAGQS